MASEEIFGESFDEQKGLAREAASMEKVEEIAKGEGTELSIDDLGQAAGGYDFENWRHMSQRERER